MRNPPETKPAGRVTLVGAGPGDPELLTLKAVRALQEADVVLFDALVSEEVLGFVRTEARKLLVGKRGGRVSCRQDDINAMMLNLAAQGRRVVRLKAGDPMIFGRAGEEIAVLREAGIAVEVVPGITAAMAAASKFGVSLTHRDCAQAVKFITAHSRKGELPDLDWRACADPATTLIVYMGARTAAGLSQRLTTEGLDPATPVVIAKGVCQGGEEVTCCRLGELVSLQIDREKPVLIGIGAVFAEMLEQFEAGEGGGAAAVAIPA